MMVVAMSPKYEYCIVQSAFKLKHFIIKYLIQQNQYYKIFILIDLRPSNLINFF